MTAYENLPIETLNCGVQILSLNVSLLTLWLLLAFSYLGQKEPRFSHRQSTSDYDSVR